MNFSVVQKNKQLQIESQYIGIYQDKSKSLQHSDISISQFTDNIFVEFFVSRYSFKF